MPSLSPTCLLLNRDGEPFLGDYGKSCAVFEDRFEVPEYHYQAADLAALGTFDVALTHESFGAHPTAYRELIFSQRFRVLCQEHDIQMEWWPVRIDS